MFSLHTSLTGPLIAFTIACFTSGCGASDPQTSPARAFPAGEGGSTLPDAGPDAARPSSSACNDIPNDGPLVTMSMIPERAPAPKGGRIVDGVYRLTHIDVFTELGGASGPLEGVTVRRALDVRGSEVELAQDGSNGALRLSMSFTLSGTTLVLSQHCPAGSGTRRMGFTVEGAALALFEEKDGQILRYRYE